jgi:Ribosomal RNA adenine dimethylase
VLDIGAGSGALTRHLLAAGARVLAVEAHPGRAALLRERFAGTAATVLAADATTMRLPRRPYRVVASPPYAIASTLMRALLAPGSALIGADLVRQRAAVHPMDRGHGRVAAVGAAGRAAGAASRVSPCAAGRLDGPCRPAALTLGIGPIRHRPAGTCGDGVGSRTRRADRDGVSSPRRPADGCADVARPPVWRWLRGAAARGRHRSAP